LLKSDSVGGARGGVVNKVFAPWGGEDAGEHPTEKKNIIKYVGKEGKG